MLDNVGVPIPPLEIDNVPDDIFDEFIGVNCEPSPKQKDAEYYSCYPMLNLEIVK